MYETTSTPCRHVIRDWLKTSDTVKRSRLVNKCPAVRMTTIAAIAIDNLVTRDSESGVDVLIAG